MKTLLFVVTEDWYFLSHRLPMARAAQAAGYAVAVAARESTCRAAIEAHGIRFLPLALERRTLNPFAALRAIAALKRLYDDIRPAVVHHIALKPVLFGSLAARAARVPVVIDAFAGLGFVFVGRSMLARLMRILLVPMFRLALRRRNTIVLVQNADDGAALTRLGIASPHRLALIPGSGVDVDAYPVSPSPAAPPYVCIFAARMIGIKGLDALKAAFAILAARRPDIVLWMCGEPDPGNPQSWTRAQLDGWGDNVVFQGRSDMRAVWPRAHLALQPSLGGEGVPKALLEAAACGRAILATDVPGCRDVVEDRVNGALVPPGDAVALADAVDRLCGDMDRLAAMGRASRALVEARGFSARAVEAETERLYRDAPMWISAGERPARG